MSIDTDTLLRVAHLARLRLEPEQLPQLHERIDRVLAMVDQLQAVDTSGVAPMAHPRDATQRLRPDAVTESDQRELLMASAPLREQGLYLVPRVIE